MYDSVSDSFGFMAHAARYLIEDIAQVCELLNLPSDDRTVVYIIFLIYFGVIGALTTIVFNFRFVRTGELNPDPDDDLTEIFHKIIYIRKWSQHYFQGEWTKPFAEPLKECITVFKPIFSRQFSWRWKTRYLENIRILSMLAIGSILISALVGIYCVLSALFFLVYVAYNVTIQFAFLIGWNRPVYFSLKYLWTKNRYNKVISLEIVKAYFFVTFGAMLLGIMFDQFSDLLFDLPK